MKTLDNTLYIQTQGTYIHLERDTLKLEVEQKTKFQVPLHHLMGIVAFGNILVSPFLIYRCAADGRDLVWLSQYGQFKARLTGPTTGNVLLRRAQQAALNDPARTLSIARCAVAGKLQNARTLLLRSARDAKDEGDRAALKQAAQTHAEAIGKLEQAENLDQLRGWEGQAAKTYFGVLDRGIRQERETFAMTGRSRPPRDPINSLLSLLYTLLTNECVAACEAVGLDPQIGFLHALRPGRPALALDLMEELRPALVDRLVLTLINRRQVQPDDFVERPGGTIYLSDAARKVVLHAYQTRKQEEVTHPVLQTKLPWGLVAHIQARLLARHLRGDLPHYPPFLVR